MLDPYFQVKGFCGAQLFSDRAEGTVQSLTLWESWADLETAVGDKRYAKVTAFRKARSAKACCRLGYRRRKLLGTWGLGARANYYNSA